MIKLTNALPQRKHIRLSEFDYSQQGAYFITIVTQQRACLFGSIIKGEMILNDAGKMIEQVCHELPKFIPNVDFNFYQIMPNHLHGIIELKHNKAADLDKSAQPFPPAEDLGWLATPEDLVSLPLVVKRFKSLTTRRYIDGVRQFNWRCFDHRLWQRNYYEHVIRDEKDYQWIVDYISSNPENWEKDEEYRLD